MNKTLIAHIFNEEYLLPFWLAYHKNIFDNLIIIDYESTDDSLKICNTIWPNCTIIKTRNKFFDARETDREVMYIENSVNGIKMVLNITEFLFCEGSINEMFNEQLSYAVNIYSAYSINNYDIQNYNDFFSNLLNARYHINTERGVRQIHNFPNGNYGIGRHGTSNNSTPTNKVHIIWCGFYPMNEKTLKRKLQIKQKMSQRDKDTGCGFQHLYNKETILKINYDSAKTGDNLKEINIHLYNIISNFSFLKMN
jgi:hypothetical protein